MRGLESLIPQKKSGYTGEASGKESVFLIDIEHIKPNPYQPRREFNREDLQSLADSIKVYGILQPLMVSKVEKEVPSGRKVEYELIAGERRLRAAKIAKLPRVPVIVRHLVNNAQKLEVSLIENIQRNDLSPLEEAQAFQRLQKEFGMSQADIARRVSKSRPYVANIVRMLSLPKGMQDALSRGDINEGHTRPLLSLASLDAQEKLFADIVNQRFTVRQAEERARQLLVASRAQKGRSSSGGKSNVDPQLVELLERFKNSFNISRAHIKTDGRKARLALSFSSKKELTDWVEKLLD